jgi:error-prone DNA polymerase
MRLVKGLREEHAHAIEAAVRQHGGFDTIEQLRRAGDVRIGALRRLAAADAFQSMGLDRQTALWQVRALSNERLPMFEDVKAAPGLMKEDPDHAAPSVRASSVHSSFAVRDGVERVSLPPVSPPRKVLDDYATLGLSLKAHPLSFLRARLEKHKVQQAVELKDESRWPQGRHVSVAGIVLVRQRPGTASGIVFMTIEDETGIANLIIRPHIFEKYRQPAKHGVIIIARGKVERQGEVIHINVTRLEDAGEEMRSLLARSRDFH